METDLDDVDERPAKRQSAPPPRPGRGRLTIVLGLVVAVAAVAVVVLLVKSSSSTSKGNKKPPAAATFTTYTNRSAGFSLDYPSTWQLGKSSDPSVPLLLSFGAGGLDTLLVRVVPLQGSVDPTNVTDIKAFTDAIISGTKVTVLKQQAVTVGSRPGYYYFYTLPPSSGVTLVHSHFFVFPPHEMVEMVFQAEDPDFAGLAHSFDQVISSFQVVPTS